MTKMCPVSNHLGISCPDYCPDITIMGQLLAGHNCPCDQTRDMMREDAPIARGSCDGATGSGWAINLFLWAAAPVAGAVE